MGGLKLETTTSLHPELLGPVVMCNHSLQPTAKIPLLHRWPFSSCLNTSSYGELTAENHGREPAAQSAGCGGRGVGAWAAFLPQGGAALFGLPASWPSAAASRKDSDFQRKCILILLSASRGLSQPRSSLLSLQHEVLGGWGVVTSTQGRLKPLLRLAWVRRVNGGL